MFDLKSIASFFKLSIGSFLLVFLIFEVIIRFFFPQKIEPSLFISKFGTFINQHKANIHEKLTYEGIPYHLKIDEHNLRNFKTITYKKPPNTFRILSLGDSMFKGPGLEVEEIFAFYLDQTLNKHRSKFRYEVVNAAMGGANFLDYILYLKNEGYKYSPDLILLPVSNYDFGPEDLDNFYFENILAERINSEEIQITLSNPKINVPSSFLNRLMVGLSQIPFYTELSKVSHLLNLIRLKSNILLLEREENPLDNLDHFLKTRNVLKKNEEAKNLRIKWFLGNYQVYAPYLRSKSLTLPLFSEIAEILFKTVDQIGAKLAILDIPEDEELFGEPSATTPIKFAEKKGVYQFNLLGPMQQFLTKNQFPLNIPQDPHWNPAGHYLVAILTYNFLLKNKQIPEENLSQKIIIDLNSPEIIKQIKDSNKRVNPYIDKPQYKYFLKGLIAKNNGQIKSAIKNLEQYLRLKQDYNVNFQLAELYLKNKELNNALRHLKEAKKFKNSTFLEKLGQKYYELGLFKDSLQVFLNVKAVGDPSVEVIDKIGLCYKNLGIFLESEKHLTLAAEKEPYYIQHLGDLYFDNEYFEKAIDQYNKLLILYPGANKFHYLIGLSYLNLGDFEQAEKMLLEAKRIQPQNKSIQSILDQIQTLKNK